MRGRRGDRSQAECVENVNTIYMFTKICLREKVNRRRRAKFLASSLSFFHSDSRKTPRMQETPVVCDAHVRSRSLARCVVSVVY